MGSISFLGNLGNLGLLSQAIASPSNLSNLGCTFIGNLDNLGLLSHVICHLGNPDFLFFILK